MSQELNSRQPLQKNPHCQNCGKINPSVLEYGMGGEGEGFTECCHEAVCDGTKVFIFGNDQVEVRACCWAVAELEFKAQGIDVLAQKTMRRFDLM